MPLGGTLTTPERFTVLTGGPTSDERDARLAEGADELAGSRRGRLLGNERFLLGLAAGLRAGEATVATGGMV